MFFLHYKKLNKNTFNDRCIMDENFSYFSCVPPCLSAQLYIELLFQAGSAGADMAAPAKLH